MLTSGWNLTRMARTLQLRHQFRIRLPRLPVLRLRGMLPFHQVGVDFFLACQIKREGAVYLLQAQRGIALHHALRRDPLSKQIDQRIERDPGISDPIRAVDELNVLLWHSLTQLIHGHTLGTARPLLTREHFLEEAPVIPAIRQVGDLPQVRVMARVGC